MALFETPESMQHIQRKKKVDSLQCRHEKHTVAHLGTISILTLQLVESRVHTVRVLVKFTTATLIVVKRCKLLAATEVSLYMKVFNCFSRALKKKEAYHPCQRF